MKHEMDAQVLSVYISENDKWKDGLLCPAIIERLSEIGVDAVSVHNGIEGFGAHRRLHTSRIEVLFAGMPIVIIAVGSTDKIAGALMALDDMLDDGLITTHNVRLIEYTKT